MTYTYNEVKSILAGCELSIRQEREFSKLSESSSQAELDKFVKRNRRLFEKRSAEQEAFERYMSLKNAVLDASHEDGQDCFEIANNLLIGNSDDSADYVLKLQAEMAELYPTAKKWADFVRVNI